MILTAHQPVYLPWLGLFHKIASADTFVSFDDVQYLPRDWNSRNKIRTADGVIWLTVPVLTKGHREKPIREIEINNREPWRRKHWNSISMNYRRAPFFAQYEEFLRSVYQREWQLLWELNEYMLHWFLATLGIQVTFRRASELGLKGAKSALVLDLCRKVGTTSYISGCLGRNYMDEVAFEKAGIKVFYQDYHHPTYKQLYPGFEPFMSVIDLLFNCGPDSLDVLMRGQQLATSLRDQCGT